MLNLKKGWSFGQYLLSNLVFQVSSEKVAKFFHFNFPYWSFISSYSPFSYIPFVFPT